MDVFTTWADVFRVSLQSVTFGVIDFLPSLLLAIITFFIGWAFAGIVSRGIQSLSKKSKFEDLFNQAGITGSLAKSGIHFSAGKLIGEILRWVLIIVFLIPALELVGLSEITSLLKTTAIEFLPKVILAAFVLVIAAVIAEAMKRVVETAAGAANVSSAKTLGSFVKYSIWIFAVLIALTELGIASTLIYILLIGVVGMFAVGGAIAIGTGGKDIARDILTHMREEFRPKR